LVVPLLLEPPSRWVRAYLIAVENLDLAPVSPDLGLERGRERRLACAGQTREPQGDTLIVS
jgi:hypothetical protein